MNAIRRTSPTRPAWTRFLSRLPFAAMTALLIWLAIRPALDASVCRLAEMLIRGYEYPRVTRLHAEEHHAHIQRADLRTGSAVPSIPLTEIHFNTVVLLALFLAFANPQTRVQLERLVMGWSVLLATQVVNLVAHVKFLYATAMGDWSASHYSELGRNVYGFLQYFTDLPGRFAFPFLIWVLFNWDLVMEMITSDQRENS